MAAFVMRVLVRTRCFTYYSQPYLTTPTAMKVTWRFFVDSDMRWRWQQLTTDRAVIAESQASYDDYEGCIAAARSVGYVFEAAQGKLVRPGNERFSRR